MIAVDTNVLLRYLLHADDPAQGALAVGLIDGAREREEQVYVSSVVLCELAWTLKAALRLKRSDLMSTIREILARSESTGSENASFALEHAEAVRRALEDYGRGKAEFSDYVIGRVSEAAGASTTYTFDRSAAAAATFKRLSRNAIL